MVLFCCVFSVVVVLIVWLLGEGGGEGMLLFLTINKALPAKEYLDDLASFVSCTV